MKVLYDLADDFLSLLFPRICHGCGNHLMRNEHIICTECRVLIPQTEYHNVRGNPVEQLFWGRCRLDRAAAFSYYTRGSRIRKLIHSLKYNGNKEVGTELGKIYGNCLKSSGFLNGIDMIVPVPLHPSKERSRGFNQALIIAEGISSVTGIRVEKNAVIRLVRTKTQTRRSRYERWTNVEGIFHIADAEKIPGKHILLVDDVITTGSTIEACATELSKIKEVTVSVAALAYAVM